MKHDEISGICNSFATIGAEYALKTVLYQGLLRHSVYLCEFDPPRNRKFYVKVL